MKYISFDKYKPSAEWLEKARNASREVAESEPEERSKAISKHASLWGELKEKLEEISHGKCWYCESRETRSDKHVDHYRPKNRIRDDNSEGYWWLAFDYKNYRYCCILCNCRRTDVHTGSSGGKWDYFPLFDGCSRAGCHEELKDEDPLLLDPTDSNDPGLIWFDESGEAKPRYPSEERERDYKRAEKSIELYHLNHTDLREARLAFAERIKRFIKDGIEYFQSTGGTRDRSAELGLKRVKDELRRMIDEKSEYSSAAKALLMGMREYPWVEEVLATT